MVWYCLIESQTIGFEVKYPICVDKCCCSLFELFGQVLDFVVRVLDFFVQDLDFFVRGLSREHDNDDNR